MEFEFCGLIRCLERSGQCGCDLGKASAIRISWLCDRKLVG